MNSALQVYTDEQKEPCAGTQSQCSIVSGSITNHTVSLQINPHMFHMVPTKYFATVLDVYRGQGFSSHLGQFDLGKNTSICWMGGWVRRTASVNALQERKIPNPYQHSKLWQTNLAYSLFGYVIPAPTGISKYINISCMTFHSHCIMGVTPMKIHMNDYASTDCSKQPGNIKILPHCLKEYGFNIFYLELCSK